MKKLLPAAGGPSPAPEPPPATSPLDADLLAYHNYLTAERGMADNTVMAYLGDLDRFARWAAAGGLADYLKPTLAELVNYLERLHAEGLGASSVARHVASLKGLYKFLALEGRAVGPAVGVLEAPAAAQHLPRCLSVASVVKLLEAPGDGDRYPCRDRAILETLYASGCRVSEALGMRLEDVTDAGVRVNHGKGGKDRIVLLGRPARQALADYLARERPRLARLAPGLPWLFVSQWTHDGPMKRCMVWNIVKRYARRVGLPAVHPHVLRHSFATHMLAGGADIRVIQELLGHASINTTQKYTHLEMSRLREVHAQHHPRGR